MPRRARIVLPNTPHHVTQRGVRRQVVFHHDADYLAYLSVAAGALAAAVVQCALYCLMPNHVHFIVTPATPTGLAEAFSRISVEYARRINRRERCTGHLWQERFASFPMDEGHAHQALRYVGLNPVRAGLVGAARDWPWSNVASLIDGRDDPVADNAGTRARIGPDLPAFFAADVAAEARSKLRRASHTGRPLGGAAWLKALEQSHAIAPPRPRGRPRRLALDAAPPYPLPHAAD